MNETLEQKVARLEAENARLKAAPARGTALKVTEKGGVSFYGVGRWPVTLYESQWNVLLGNADKIRAFLKEHESELAVKQS